MEPDVHVRIVREDTPDVVRYTIYTDPGYERFLIGVKGRTATTLRSLTMLLEKAYSGKHAAMTVAGDMGYFFKDNKNGDNGHGR